ncbi:hypothetical protein KUV50_12070 [Membranicola marinus]|uniref:DNA polymerase III, psi subunit n=1 Tax=Membranihabitans marinus TaxID=1227546 RepID=A0A953HW31_9BACT|nr:hypothetical protein [Membranihabitans marinus]MBY5958878.1 hypothetical protein [Membranihabitans marinus]
MAVKNPFIRYKIYSTTPDPSDVSGPLVENVKVLCLITKEDMDWIPFLKKILAAAKLPEKENKIITLSKEDSFSAADQGWLEKAEFILLFGLSPSTIGVQVHHKLYQSTTLRKTTLLQIPKLKNIEPHKEEKQKLWQLMKKVFLHE